MAHKLERITNRASKKSYFGIPKDLLQSDVWASLHPRAVKLLCDLGAQYYGCNNGDLCMAWKILCKKGWSSRDQLSKARIELLDKGLIEMTRKGGKNRASLFALTFCSIDDCIDKVTGWSKFDPNIRPTRVASNKWKKISLARVAGQC